MVVRTQSSNPPTPQPSSPFPPSPHQSNCMRSLTLSAMHLSPFSCLHFSSHDSPQFPSLLPLSSHFFMTAVTSHTDNRSNHGIILGPISNEIMSPTCNAPPSNAHAAQICPTAGTTIIAGGKSPSTLKFQGPLAAKPAPEETRRSTHAPSDPLQALRQHIFVMLSVINHA